MTSEASVIPLLMLGTQYAASFPFKKFIEETVKLGESRPKNNYNHYPGFEGIRAMPRSINTPRIPKPEAPKPPPPPEEYDPLKDPEVIKAIKRVKTEWPPEFK
ncbi:MAG: hypothetical protein LLG37_09175 [Spirochaetia bacterium]|nr:hypothetical protein [Spirochaetia bacterium]